MKIILSVLLMMCSVININPEQVSAKNNSWSWPVEGKITDFFGTRKGHHYGIDIGGKVGTPIHVVEGGKVVKSYYSTSYGNVVFVKHPDGYETVYAHLKKRYVKQGERVIEGEIVGELGNSGHSTGPHLHFEVHKGEWNYAKSNVVNPLTMLLQGDQVVSAVGDGMYVVEEGDTLFSIAKKFQTTTQKLKVYNSLSGDIIYPQQKLMVK